MDADGVQAASGKAEEDPIPGCIADDDNAAGRLGVAGAASQLRDTPEVAVTLQDVREFALPLPRTYERTIRDRVKFKVGQYVYLALSRDETTMGFAFPKQERAGLIASDPVKFLPPVRSDERYNWVVVRLSEIDRAELREIVEDAWRMVVPKRLAAEVLGPL